VVGGTAGDCDWVKDSGSLFAFVSVIFILSLHSLPFQFLSRGSFADCMVRVQDDVHWRRTRVHRVQVFAVGNEYACSSFLSIAFAVESLTCNSTFHIEPCRGCHVPPPRQIQIRIVERQRDLLVDGCIHRSECQWGPEASAAIDR
jgi:hypothetical protein